MPLLDEKWIAESSKDFAPIKIERWTVGELTHWVRQWSVFVAQAHPAELRRGAVTWDSLCRQVELIHAYDPVQSPVTCLACVAQALRRPDIFVEMNP